MSRALQRGDVMEVRFPKHDSTPQPELKDRTQSCPDRDQIVPTFVPSVIPEIQSEQGFRTHRTHRTQFSENFSDPAKWIRLTVR